MNEITIMISGMVLLMAPIAYQQSGSDKIHAAVAVNATEPTSSYGVDIPQHFAALVFSSADLSTLSDPGKRVAPDENDASKMRVQLLGDRVQIGTFDSGNKICNAVADDPNAANATTSNSFKDVPRMRDLVENLVLDADTYPAAGDFSGIKPKKVAGWFEIPLGRLRALHSDHPQDDEVAFRPTHRTGTVVPTIEWRIQSGNADCVVVKPFNSGSRIDISFKAGNKVMFRYENSANMDSGEVVPGIGYDFEVLYGLFTTKPTIPPLPYGVVVPQRAGTTINGDTGVNCGPASLPGGP